jgi:ABC-2 type transport system ATP-binding protein
MTDLVLELDGVEKAYRFFRLADVRLRLEAGQIMGFVGPNGAGKSTTIRILMGMIRQDRGSVRVLGHPMPREQAAAKQDVGFVSEDCGCTGTRRLRGT